MKFNDHYEKTKSFFTASAIEKQGYYDGTPERLKHTCWQLWIRNMVIKAISGLIKSDSNIKSLLDVGCGRGDLVKDIACRFPHFTEISGTDFSKEALDIGRQEMAFEPRVFFKETDILHMPFEDNQFDIVTCINVIHHIHKDDLPDALIELTRITRKYLIIEIKNKDNFYWRYLHPSYTRSIDIFPVSLSEINRVLKIKGFSLRKEKGIFLFSFLSPLLLLTYKKEDEGHGLNLK